MIYGDIPFETDQDILECKLEFNRYDFYKYYKQQYFSFSKRVANYNNFHQQESISVYQDVNDIIKMCLSQDSSERIKLENILDHKWFKHN